MRRSATIFARIVAAVGFGALAAVVYQMPPEGDIRFLAYLALSALLSLWKIKLPGLAGTFSLNCILILAAIVSMPAGKAVIIATASAAAQSLWNTRKRPALIQVMFNVGTLSLTTAACHIACEAARRMAPETDLLVLMPFTALLYFAMNTLLVSMVLALAESKPLSGVWNVWLDWASLYYLGAAGVAAFITWAGMQGHWAPPLLVLPFGYLFCRGYQKAVPAVARA